MYEQFQHVMKLGPINRLMSMIPGLPEVLVLAGAAHDDGCMKVVPGHMHDGDHFHRILFFSSGDYEQRERERWWRTHQALHVYDGQVVLQKPYPFLNRQLDNSAQYNK